MSELNNVVTAAGTYNSIPTSLTSNASVVNIIEGLTITKSADKTNWTNGNLTYTIILENKAEYTYEKPIVTDIIDTTLVDFIEGSVTINNATATTSQYNYDTGTHTLTINLEDVMPSASTTLTFQVKKKA